MLWDKAGWPEAGRCHTGRCLRVRESKVEAMSMASPSSSGDQQPQRAQQPPYPERERERGSVPSGPNVNQRLGLAVISLVFLVFLGNIMAAFSSSFGPIGSTIGFVAGCLTVLGINVVFNLDVFGHRR